MHFQATAQQVNKNIGKTFFVRKYKNQNRGSIKVTAFFLMTFRENNQLS